jgi:hypothetical protein
MATYAERIVAHYSSFWGLPASIERWERGPAHELSPDFRILVFAPRKSRTCWTYATCGMSEPEEDEPIELHLFSPVESPRHVETLTAIAHIHRTGERLGLGHTVNLGRPWLDSSRCEFGLLSLPYLDAPSIERCAIAEWNIEARCLWLISITEREREFKKLSGLDALEWQFELKSFNYLVLPTFRWVSGDGLRWRDA